MDLEIGGRTALVMGASRGLGRGIATALAREGANVALASRSLEHTRRAAEEIDAELGDASGELLALEADTSDLERLGELPGEVAGRLGPVDILVLNTGGPPAGGALGQGTGEWEHAYRNLVLAPRVLVEAALPGMCDRGWGRIVNVGSTSTIEPIPTLGLSNVHRMAAVGFLKTLSREVAAEGITVNTVATGRFATERIAELSGGSLEPAVQAARQEVPAGRLGDPAEYGDLVAFLCSERARYLTGATIPLDGGLLRSV